MHRVAIKRNSAKGAWLKDYREKGIPETHARYTFTTLMHFTDAKVHTYEQDAYTMPIFPSPPSWKPTDRYHRVVIKMRGSVRACRSDRSRGCMPCSGLCRAINLQQRVVEPRDPECFFPLTVTEI